MNKREIKDLKDDLQAAKDREEQFQAELDFSRKEQSELETEILAIENGVYGVGLPISSLIRKIEVIESDSLLGKETHSIREIFLTLKIVLLRIQRLEVEVRKLKR